MGVNHENKGPVLANPRPLATTPRQRHSARSLRPPVGRRDCRPHACFSMGAPRGAGRRRSGPPASVAAEPESGNLPFARAWKHAGISPLRLPSAHDRLLERSRLSCSCPRRRPIAYSLRRPPPCDDSLISRSASGSGRVRKTVARPCGRGTGIRLSPGTRQQCSAWHAGLAFPPAPVGIADRRSTNPNEPYAGTRSRVLLATVSTTTSAKPSSVSNECSSPTMLLNSRTSGTSE